MIMRVDGKGTLLNCDDVMLCALMKIINQLYVLFKKAISVSWKGILCTKNNKNNPSKIADLQYCKMIV